MRCPISCAAVPRPSVVSDGYSAEWLVAEATTLGLAERFGSLRLDHQNVTAADGSIRVGRFARAAPSVAETAKQTTSQFGGHQVQHCLSAGSIGTKAKCVAVFRRLTDLRRADHDRQSGPDA